MLVSLFPLTLTFRNLLNSSPPQSILTQNADMLTHSRLVTRPRFISLKQSDSMNGQYKDCRVDRWIHDYVIGNFIQMS